MSIRHFERDLPADTLGVPVFADQVLLSGLLALLTRQLGLNSILAEKAETYNAVLVR